MRLSRSSKLSIKAIAPLIVVLVSWKLMMDAFHQIQKEQLISIRKVETMDLSVVREAAGQSARSSSHLTGPIQVVILQKDRPVSEESYMNCSIDLDGSKPVLDQIVIQPSTPQSPSVLCYILCNSQHHERAEMIKKTWGSRCDGFLVASNETDEALGAVAIPTRFPHTRDYLWEKQRETMRYLYQQNISQYYDWLFKADTDTYAIVENLKAHLSQMDMSKPQLVGCLVGTAAKRRLIKDEAGEYITTRWGLTPEQMSYYNKQKEEDQWIYAAGAGYAMNQNFVEKMVSVLDTEGCLPNITSIPEGAGTAFCVSSAFPLSPTSACDENGLQMYHEYEPSFYSRQMKKQAMISLTMGTRQLPNPPSPKSVIFHNLKENTTHLFHFIDDQLYSCRQRQRAGR